MNALLQDANFPRIWCQCWNLQKASLGKRSQQKTHLQIDRDILIRYYSQGSYHSWWLYLDNADQHQVHKWYSAHENFHDFCSCCSTCLHRRHESCTAVKAALFYHLAYKHWKSRGGIIHRFHKKQNLCLCNFIWLKDKHRCCICRYDIYNAILSIMFCFKDGKTLSIYLS